MYHTKSSDTLVLKGSHGPPGINGNTVVFTIAFRFQNLVYVYLLKSAYYQAKQHAE